MLGEPQLLRKAVAEFLGTAFLLLAVIGSGIAASRLSPHDTGLALLENAIATGGALVAIILAVGPVSGSHLNPVVTIADLAFGGLSRAAAAVYVVGQLLGAAVGAILANLIYGLQWISTSTHDRSSPSLWLSEVVATLGLLLVIFGVVRSRRAGLAPFAVGAYITGAYFFTSSTSFANPAVTVARSLSNTFAGIAPTSVPMFLIAQMVGCGVAIATVRYLYPHVHEEADELVVPHQATNR
ncbi:MAG: MIP/aquaporin family protein [Candidatus Dormibacteria bacterium]